MTPAEEKALDDIVFMLSTPHTQEEIACRLGISQQRVDQIEGRALGKLRALMVDGWDSGLREPSILHRRHGDVFPGDGSAERRGSGT